jgi:hypothetical protein|tara:strand:- start:68 stop:259 length:192 start_codon:yes stop_codon:yes gene_type:complete
VIAGEQKGIILNNHGLLWIRTVISYQIENGIVFMKVWHWPEDSNENGTLATHLGQHWTEHTIE